MDLAEDSLKWTLPFQLQWIEELEVLGRLRQLAPELERQVHCEGVVAAQVRGHGRRLPEVVVRIRESRSGGGDSTPVKDVATTLADSSDKGSESTGEAESLAAQISGRRLYQWMLGGIPLPDANSAELGLSEAYQLPCELQLKYVSEDGAPYASSNVGTGKPDFMCAWEVARAMLGMTAAEASTSTAAAADEGAQVFVKPSPRLTCVVWSATGAQIE